MLRLRGQLYVARSSSFLTLKYTDVNRETKTNLDNVEEGSVDDCWNVDSNTTLSEDWIGLTRFNILMKRPPKR